MWMKQDLFVLREKKIVEKHGVDILIIDFFGVNY